MRIARVAACGITGSMMVGWLSVVRWASPASAASISRSRPSTSGRAPAPPRAATATPARTTSIERRIRSTKPSGGGAPSRTSDNTDSMRCATVASTVSSRKPATPLIVWNARNAIAMAAGVMP